MERQKTFFIKNIKHLIWYTLLNFFPITQAFIGSSNTVTMIVRFIHNDLIRNKWEKFIQIFSTKYIYIYATRRVNHGFCAFEFIMCHVNVYILCMANCMLSIVHMNSSEYCFVYPKSHRRLNNSEKKWIACVKARVIYAMRWVRMMLIYYILCWVSRYKQENESINISQLKRVLKGAFKAVILFKMKYWFNSTSY